MQSPRGFWHFYFTDPSASSRGISLLLCQSQSVCLPPSSLPPKLHPASCSSPCPCTPSHPFFDLPSALALKPDLCAGAWAAISALFGLGLPLILHGACLYAGVSPLAVSYSTPPPLPFVSLSFRVLGPVLMAQESKGSLIQSFNYIPAVPFSPPPGPSPFALLLLW